MKKKGIDLRKMAFMKSDVPEFDASMFKMAMSS